MLLQENNFIFLELEFCFLILLCFNPYLTMTEYEFCMCYDNSGCYIFDHAIPIALLW